MVRNSAHDSICACSVDDVVDAVLHRYAEARAIATGLADRAVKAFARSMAEPGTYRAQPVTARPVGRRRGGRPRRRAGAGRRPGALGALGPARVDGARRQHGAHHARHAAGAQDRRRRLGPRHQDRGDRRGHRHHARRRHRGAPERPHRGGQAGPLHPAGRAPRRRGARRHGSAPDPEDRRPHRRGARIRVERLRAGASWSTRSRSSEPDGSVVLTNGLVRVEVDRPDGTFSLDGIAGLRPAGRRRRPRRLLQLLAAAARLRRRHARVRHRAGRRAGPVRARARITTTYTWPDHVDGASQRRVGEHGSTVDTDVELRADEPVVRVTTSFVNPSGDHRLRVHLPLPDPASQSQAESRLHRRHARPDRRGPGRRVRAADGTRQPLRDAPVA